MMYGIPVLILLLGVFPVLSGLLTVNFIEQEKRSLGVAYLSGFLLLLAVFQLVAVPVVFADPWGFPTIIRLYTAAVVILSLAGPVVTLLFRKRQGSIFCRKAGKEEVSKVEKAEWILFFLLLLWQLYMALAYASFDGDDAYYVVNSVLTDETDTLYRIRPYTGLSTGLDMRHAMAVFPLWISYLARMSGIHATVISHSLLPLLLIPVTYGIYLQIGKKLCGRHSQQLPVFMILTSLLQIFGNVSIYTNATFLLTRTWQGKSVLANIVIPALFWLLLWIFDGQPGSRPPRKGLWVLLFLLNLTAAMMSTASVFLVSLLVAVMGCVLAVREKNPHILWKLALTCLPGVIYGVLYVLS